MIIEVIFLTRSGLETSTTEEICLPVEVTTSILILAHYTTLYWVGILHIVAVKAIHALHVEV